MSKKGDFKLIDALSLAWELGFLIIVPIGGFLFLGFFADSFFSSRPLFIIIGLVVGICIAGYGTYRSLKPFLRDDTKDDEK